MSRPLHQIARSERFSQCCSDTVAASQRDRGAVRHGDHIAGLPQSLREGWSQSLRDLIKLRHQLGRHHGAAAHGSALHLIRLTTRFSLRPL